jgi:hypothetical protein
MRENRPSGLMRGGQQTVVGLAASQSVASRLLYTLPRSRERLGRSVWVARHLRRLPPEENFDCPDPSFLKTGRMRVAFACAAFVLGLVFSAPAAPKIVIPPSPLEAKPGDLHAFYGQVKGVDRAAGTIAIELPMRFTFRVQAATQINVRRGGAVALDAVKPGAGAQIVARREAKGWTALKITLEPGATFPEEMSARTVQGKTIKGLAVAKFIAYEPPAQLVNRNINFGQRSGLFLLSLRPDGSVANVRPIKSLGVTELDERAGRRLMKMKFRAGALSEARIPVSFKSFRRY